MDISYPLVAEGTEDRKPVEVVYKTISAGNKLSVDFISYVIVACIIAGAGIATNNGTAGKIKKLGKIQRNFLLVTSNSQDLF